MGREAILGLRAEISQIPGVPGLSALQKPFFSWWNKENRALILPILSVSSFYVI